MGSAMGQELAMLVGEDGKRFILRLESGGELQTHLGVIQHDGMIGLRWGSETETHLGNRLRLVRPTIRDVLLNTKRRSQIIFPKDIGYILLRLSIGPGARVLEAGTGSGALTTAFAWAVGDEGHVYSYDRRADMQTLAHSNLQQSGLESRVTLCLADINDGFKEEGLDALFLDVSNPQDYLAHAHAALCDGGAFGSILPTANQVSDLIRALPDHTFFMIDVCEILLRFYKPVPQRLRPADRMVAHTGYLVFARSILSELPDRPPSQYKGPIQTNSQS